ncbi:hypothetical protein BH09ACT6_BH09ACT6_25300 [soil metagenome]
MRLYLASTSPARLSLLRQAGIEPVIVPSNVDEDAAVAAAEAEAGPLSAGELVILLARLKAEAVQGALPGGEPIDGFILGGDSAFEFDGVIYGKPHLPHVARERWLRHRGRTGVLHSGHWMIDHRLPRAAPLATTAGGLASSPAASAGSTAPASPSPSPAGSATPAHTPAHTTADHAGSVTLVDAPAVAPAGASGALFPAAGAVTSATVEFAPDITEAEIDAYVATGEPLNVAGAFTIDGLAAPFITHISGAPSTVVGMSLPTLRDLLAELGVSWTDFWAAG